MRRIAGSSLLVALAVACGNSDDRGGGCGGGGSDAGVDTDTDTDTGTDTDSDTDSDSDTDDPDAANVVDASPSLDAATPSPDAAAPPPDAAPSLFAPTQYADRSCQSFGGFGAVHRNSPAKVWGFIDDQDGLADLATVAEVVIIGDGTYSLGDRAVTSLQDDGCCQRVGEVVITYDDFVAAAGAGIAPDGFWGVQVNFRDLGGNTTSAICAGAAGWYLDADPI